MSNARKVFSFALTVVIGAVFVGGLLFHERIIDRVKVWQYDPSPEIAQLAERAGFSDEGRFYFYATHPRLESAEQFNEDCQRREQGSPVLGCYHPSTDTIYIYAINNAQLDGIQEVTAAHEMLHAVFERMPHRDAERLASLLERAYEQNKTERLESRMAYYERAQPGSRINELHSIVGTEFAEIGQELEEYYSAYFADRSKTVALYQSYSGQFYAIEQEMDDLTEQMERQRPVIDARSEAYGQGVAAFNQRVQAFNAQASRPGGFASQAAFEQARAELVRETNTLEAERVAIQRLVDEYNQLVIRYNSLGGQMNELQKSLDSLQGVE